MKVTGIRARALQAALPAPMRSRGDVGYSEYFHTGSEVQRITVVEVLTDSEHVGVTLLTGDATEWLQAVATPALLGLDARAIRKCTDRLVSEHGNYRSSLNLLVERADWPPSQRARAEAAQRSLASAPRSHLNRLEFALWDLAAKSVGRPLFRFLGGMDPTVRVYAGGGSLCWNPLPMLIREAETLLDRGFRAVKIKIGHGPEEDGEIIRAIRAEVGPDIQIMVDANRAYDLAGALRLSEALQREQIGWFEEPFGYECPDEWCELHRVSGIPLAGGEGFSTISEASRAVTEKTLQILQCDSGGFNLEALLATATLAHEGGVGLTPHSCNSVIGFLVACHLHTALPNSRLQEMETFDNPFIHTLFNEAFTPREGAIRLSETPGLGVTLNEEAIAHYLVA